MAAWIASWRDSHASLTAWPEAEKAQTTIDGSGRQLRTAFAELSPDSSSWRTYPACDLLGDSPLFSQTWPRSGSVSNGIASERPTLELATNGSEFSSSGWMTPMVPNGGRSVSAEVVAAKGQTESGKRTVGLESQVRHAFATPDCNTSTKSNGLMGPNIREQAANWPTPDAAVANDGETPETWQVRANKLKAKHGNGNGAGKPLTIASLEFSSWPTPAARDLKSESASPLFVERRTTESRGQTLSFTVTHVFLPPAPTAANGLQSSETTDTSRRRLNPAFVCWLMGWPWFWTNPGRISFAAQETALWRCRLRSRLSSLLGEPELLEDAA